MLSHDNECTQLYLFWLSPHLQCPTSPMTRAPNVQYINSPLKIVHNKCTISSWLSTICQNSTGPNGFRTWLSWEPETRWGKQKILREKKVGFSLFIGLDDSHMVMILLHFLFSENEYFLMQKRWLFRNCPICQNNHSIQQKAFCCSCSSSCCCL